VRFNGRDLKPFKAIVAPLLDARTVLTTNHWGFVSLWLKRERKAGALFYWDQAKQFHRASIGMPPQSSPLLHYYSFMNAAKALLAAKNVTFDQRHGVKAHNMRQHSSKISLSNEGVKIQNTGIVPALSAYLGEAETNHTHSLQEIFFNLPFIHRTYCLTYASQTDMFIPLVDCAYVFDTATKQVHLQARLSKDFAHSRYVKRLPPALVADASRGDIRAIRSAITVPVGSSHLKTAADLAALARLNQDLRKDILYINGAQTLWYAKASVSGPRRLERFPLTLTLAAMHRLSEICRYRPVELASFLAGQKNWLVSEFIDVASTQFIDEIAAELTGYQVMTPNIRAAT
jgi:hypothetical protein